MIVSLAHNANFPLNDIDGFEGLTQILEKDWRGGVTCKLIEEGEVHLNDKVELL